MGNKVGIYHLFEGCDKARVKFFEWCKNNDEFCDYDLERLEIDLGIPVINNTERYFHFHKYNVVDFLEGEGLWFDFVRDTMQDGSLFVFDNSNLPTYIFRSEGGRSKAFEKGVKECMLLLEQRL